MFSDCKQLVGRLTGLLTELRYPDPPGYEQLSTTDRLRINLDALQLFLCSTGCLRMILYGIVGLLAGYITIWWADAQWPWAQLPVLVWAAGTGGWLTVARRRLLEKKLSRFGG